MVKIFKECLKQGLELPESKRPNEAMKVDDPNYCLYHRVVSHKIEDYWVIKDWVEKAVWGGRISLAPNVMQKSAHHE